MKTIHWLKRLDLAAQLFALIVGIYLVLNAEPGTLISLQSIGFLSLYFFVGVVQVVSCLLHAVAGWQSWTARPRRSYGALLIWVLVVGLAMAGVIYFPEEMPLVVQFIALCSAFAYLFGTPFMAIWYFIISYRETRRIAQSVQRDMLIVRSV